MKGYLFPEYDTPVIRGKNVCVVGGGNVAMDAARSALRLGADSVKIVYRRSEAELPARAEEVHHAKEGSRVLFLTNPIELLPDDRGQVRAMRIQKRSSESRMPRGVVVRFRFREPRINLIPIWW